MASLSLRNVTKEYPDGFVAAKEFNPGITDKGFIIFVGPSGCGRSTTLRMIAGLEDTSSGELYIDDKLINGVEPKDRNTAMVFQNYAPYPHTSIYDNIASGLKLRKIPEDGIDRKAHDAAKILDLEHLLDCKLKALSGDQRQRVAVGRVIIHSPKVFPMDEPLSNLDAKLRGQIYVETPKPHQKLEITIIHVTHDQTETITLGTRIVVMKNGITQQVDNPQNLYDKPCSKFVAGFIEAPQMNMIDAAVGKDGVLTTLSSSGRTVVLSGVKPKKLENAGYAGEVVTLGIRLENPHDKKSCLAMSPKSVSEATVRVYEMLGSEVLLYLDIEDVSFVAKVNPRVTARPGDTIELATDSEKIHIFGKDMELVILS